MSVLEDIGMNESVRGLVVVAALLTSAAGAHAAPVASSPSLGGQSRHSYFTSDQPRADVPAHVARLFKQLDSNHDGFVTRDEISASQAQFDARMTKAAPKRSARMFDRLDTNHDGQITRAEIEAARAARLAAKGKQPKATRRPASSALFERADANKDGIVTRAEYEAAVTNGKIKLRHANMRGSAIVRMFELADTNRDGRLSIDEAQQAALHQFDAADVNHDGVLTPDERRMASKAARSKRRPA